MPGPEKQDSDKLTEQALVVYEGLHEQVGFLKKQQWTITNYVALIYGAIFIIKKELSSLTSALECLLIAATIGAALYGLAALIVIQIDLGKARERIDKADCRVFGKKEYDYLGLQEEPRPYLRGMFFTGALMLVLVIGAGIVLFYLVS
jgi:predicted DNA repair protein MutK